jgi:hypothetical protein
MYPCTLETFRSPEYAQSPSFLQAKICIQLEVVIPISLQPDASPTRRFAQRSHISTKEAEH